MTSPFRALFLLALTLVIATVPVACGPQSSRVLVRVNGEPITEAQLIEELLKQEGARELLLTIDMQLITKAAAAKGFSISAGDLDLKYQQAAARLGSERDLEEQLKRSRRSKQQFRDELEAEALLDRLAAARNPVDEADARRYYRNHANEFSHPEQARIRLMLFAARQNAETVVEALKDPQADFAGLAKAFSEDPGTKEAGGDTGFFSRGDYARPISDAAFSLPVGKVSGVLAVPDGFAIVKVEARRPAATDPYEQVRDTVRARVALEQLEQSRRDWLNQARAGAQIVIPDKALQARVRALIDAETPFEPSNMAPDIPMAPR